MKKLLTVGVFVSLFFGMCLTVVAGEKTIKIGYLPLVMSLPTFVAMEEGYFAQEGLKVELVRFQSGTTIIDALVAGRIDANCGSASTGHWFAEQNVSGRFEIFLIYGTDSLGDNTFVVVVKKDSPIKDLKDLKGRRVGHFPGATNLALAKAIIDTQMNANEVIFTEVSPPHLIPALISGQIDLFFTPEPLGMIAVSKGVGRYLKKSPATLLDLKRGIPGGAFSFSSKFLKKSPALGKKVRAAIEKAVEFILSHDKKAREYLAKYTKLPPPVAMRIPFEKWIEIKELDRGAAQIYFDVLYREGAYKKKIDTTKLYYE